MTKRNYPFEDHTCCASAHQFAKNQGVNTAEGVRLTLVCEDCSTAEWPNTPVNAMCIRCMQVFTATPWPRPLSYIAREKHYLCEGFLCGKRCAKSYVREKNSNSHYHTQDRWLASIARDYYKVDNWHQIVPAPPLAQLCKLYNRHTNLSTALAEYNDDTVKCTVLPLPFVRATFFMEMATQDNDEKRRRTDNATRIQNHQPVPLLESRGGKRVLQRRTAQPASVAVSAAVAATESKSTIAGLLGMKVKQQNKPAPAPSRHNP